MAQAPLVAAGLDMSTDPLKTWWAEISWRPDGSSSPLLTALQGGLGPDAVVRNLTTKSFATAAVDVPFGWPASFSRLLTLHAAGPLPADVLVDSKIVALDEWYDEGVQHAWRRKAAAHRLTDRYLSDVLANRYDCRRMPLSASFDRLGSTTAMWSLIEAHLARRHSWSVGRTEYRDSDSRRSVIETYPAGQLAAWGFKQRKKPTWPEFARVFAALDMTSFERELACSDDARDAVVCALVALAHAKKSRLLGPEDQHFRSWRGADPRPEVAKEGWIWITETPLQMLLGK